MQQNRNIRLTISLAVLSIATAVVLVFGFSTGSEIDKGLFKVVDQSEVSEVRFTASKDPMQLKYDGAKWLVNGKEADRQLVRVFFATILQAEPKRKVASSLVDSLRKVTAAVKITLRKDGEMLKEYFVAGNPAKSETYFYFEGGDWYVVTIPGYRVYVASVFELTESDWREKRIFNFNWQNFKSLRTTFPQQQSEDFSITAQKQYIAIDGMEAADTTKLLGYLDQVLQMASDKLLSAEEAKSYDSLLNTSPAVTVSIYDIANREWKLSVFGTPLAQKLVLAQSNQEAILLNAKAAAVLLRGRSYFKPKK
ncbi:MAG: DUF4340 domain-containing protein [Flammeovirgaceae bacterium]